MANVEPTLRSAQVSKQEAEDLGYEGKEILEYVREQQALDREETAAWREAQKRQVEIRMAEIEAQAEKQKRADEIHIAQIESDIELGIREIELQAQATTSSATTLEIKMPSPRSYHP